ncbi:MAG: argininosuccinate synthase [Candidatus Omnitrophota bacterium]|nr:MAG: argininosuccinate synthase [Candidatus Omnitrophota bacterium]
MKRVILAYSGGLDTTCCTQWLRQRGFEVICFSAHLGSEFSPSELKKRAIMSGASKIYIKDLREEFAHKYILATLKASAVYEGKYVLSTALGRPLIAKYLANIAQQENARYIAHGCTGKGNDQVRFEVSIQILAPKLKIIAPLREWDLACREEEIAYAKKHRLPIKTSMSEIYSIDKNIWGVSIEGGALEDIHKKPPPNSYFFVKSPHVAKNNSAHVELEFQKGIPIKVNGKTMGLVKLIEWLNEQGAQAAVGRTDLIEDRVVGIKSREIYEAPAAWILHTAHKELEHLTLDRETLIFKELVSARYAQLVYQGLWFTELKKSLDAFVNAIQSRVTGKVSLDLYKGNITVVRRSSPNALYKRQLATYGKGSKFDQRLAEGFIQLWGMPYRAQK